MKEKNDFSILIYNLTRPSSCFVTREGNKYNDIHLSLSPFFLPFLRFQSTCFIVQKGKRVSHSFQPFFLFLFYFFSSSSYQISRYFFPVVVKTHTATFQWESINGWKGPQSGHKTKKIFQKNWMSKMLKMF